MYFSWKIQQFPIVCVATARVIHARHVFDFFNFSRFFKSPWLVGLLVLVYYGHHVVGPALLAMLSIVVMILSVRVVLIVSIWKSFAGLFFRSDHPLYYVFELFVGTVAEVVELPFG